MNSSHEATPNRLDAADPAATVAEIERRGSRLLTPCGSGSLVWHRWGSGPVVILLHGGFGSWTHWIRNIEPVAARHTVLAPDLPGLGESAMPPRVDDPWDLVRILAEGLSELIPDQSPYHLAGFSFGGVVAGPLAAIHGERVRSLTLVGTGGVGPPWSPVELQSWRRAPDDAARAAIHRVNLARLMFADPAAIDELAIHLQSQNAARARLKTRPIARTQLLADALSRSSTQVAAIYGKNDATVPDLALREQRLRGIVADLRFTVIEGAGHWVPYEQADAFNAELTSIIDRAERGSV